MIIHTMSLKVDRSSKSISSLEDSVVDEFCHNEIFDVLGNRRRRYILCYLLKQSNPIECSDIAEQIAAWENDLERDQVPMSQYQSVYNSLYQTHLPKLESTELVKYDRAENLVYHTNKTKEIEQFINSATSELDEPRTWYLRTLIGGLLLTAIIALTFVLVPSGGLSVSLVAAVFLSVSVVLIRGGIR